MAWITIHNANGAKRYLIRGNYSVWDLRNQHASYCMKYQSSLSFEQWLKDRGKVYVSKKLKRSY